MGLLCVPWTPTPLPHPALHRKVLFASRCSSRCKVKVKVAQSSPTLCDPLDYTVHGILQARIMGWVSFPFFRGSFEPSGQTQVPHIAGGFFTSWATRETQEHWSGWPSPAPVDLPDPGRELGSPALQAGCFFFTNWAIRCKRWLIKWETVIHLKWRLATFLLLNSLNKFRKVIYPSCQTFLSWYSYLISFLLNFYLLFNFIIGVYNWVYNMVYNVVLVSVYSKGTKLYIYIYLGLFRWLRW